MTTKGSGGLATKIEPIIFPTLYTFLALHWGTVGWVVIAVIAVAAAAAMHPAARAARRHLVAVGAPAQQTTRHLGGRVVGVLTRSEKTKMTYAFLL